MATRNVEMSGHGVRLRELRVKRGLSLRTLAARTGLSPTFISQLEADAVSPSLAALEGISHELGVTLGQLLMSSDKCTPDGVIRSADRPGYERTWQRGAAEVEKAKKEARAC